MKAFYKYLIVFLCCCTASCSSKVIMIFYNDTSKVDDGEIFGSELNRFFLKEESTLYFKTKSVYLDKELINIKKKSTVNSKFINKDDSYYSYAFITKQGDTLFANEHLDLWRYRNKIVNLKNQKLVNKIKKHTVE